MPKLSIRASPAAQRIVREAFKDLERIISPNDKSDFVDTTLENVIKAAHEVEDVLAARQSLRNMRRLHPLFTGLDYYSKSIEILCNGTPYMSWIWAPIKLILKIASDYVDAFEKIVKAYARIAEPLGRFRILNQAFFKDPEFQQTLAIFYSDILKFHGEAYKFVRRSSWEIFFLTSWGRFQRRFDDIIDNLKAHEKLVDKAANAIGQLESRKLREQLAISRQESLDRVAKDEEKHAAEQYAAFLGWLKIDDSEQLRIFDTTSNEAQKYPGTCDWILKQKTIAAWMRCSFESSFIILHGNPGTGKSVLLTTIASFLKNSGLSLLICHICTYSNQNSINYDHIMRSILLQMARNDPDLVAFIFAEFIMARKPVTTQALERLALLVVGAISRTPSRTNYIHIILDGIDECEEKKQLEIVTILERMASVALKSSSTICKILVSSHMSPTISKKLKRKHVVSLASEQNALMEAITLYAAQRLGTLRSRWNEMGINEDELERLQIRLARKADGMFLWARLVIDYLSTNLFVNKREVADAIDKLPRELKDFYGQVLARLTSQFDQRSIARMKSIFGWIAFAKRPLRKAEFRSALSFIPDTDDVNIRELTPSYFFDMCAPLIEERNDSTYAFIHISVKEYLQSPESNVYLDECSAAFEQVLVINACLLSGLEILEPGCLEHTRLDRILRGFHGLQVYASNYWIEHLLSFVGAGNQLETGTKLFSQTHELCKNLTEPSERPEQDVKQILLDNRLHCLEPYPDLFKAASAILSQQALYTGVRNSRISGNETLREITDMSTLLFNYQCTVRAALRLHCFEGLSTQELEKFKRDFRFTAFTCSLRSCFFASIGFDSEIACDEHERNAHNPCVSCEVANCQYPPFKSARALKDHQVKHHSHGIFNTKIRPIVHIKHPFGAQIVPRQVENQECDFDLNFVRREVIKVSDDHTTDGKRDIEPDLNADLKSGRKLELPKHRYPRMECITPRVTELTIRYLWFNHDGRFLTCADSDIAQIFKIDQWTGETELWQTFEIFDAVNALDVRFCALSHLLLVCEASAIWAMDISSERRYQIAPLDTKFSCIDVVSLGHSIVSGSENGTVSSWSIYSGQHLWSASLDSSVRQVTVSQNGEYVAAVDDFGNIKVWDNFSKELLGYDDFSDPVSLYETDEVSIAFSFNNSTLVVCQRRIVTIWDFCGEYIAANSSNAYPEQIDSDKFRRYFTTDELELGDIGVAVSFQRKLVLTHSESPIQSLLYC